MDAQHRRQESETRQVNMPQIRQDSAAWLRLIMQAMKITSPFVPRFQQFTRSHMDQGCGSQIHKEGRHAVTRDGDNYQLSHIWSHFEQLLQLATSWRSKWPCSTSAIGVELCSTSRYGRHPA